MNVLIRDTVLFVLVLAAISGPLNGQKIPVLQVTGQNNHDWKYTAPLVTMILEKSGRFEVTTTEEPAKFLADPANVARFRLFFLNYNGERWGDAADQNFLAAVRDGAGVFVLHAANNAFPGFKDYELLCGLCWREGTGHGAFHAFNVDVDDVHHPVTIDMPNMVDHPDELYHNLIPTPGAKYRVLMSAHSSKKSGGTDRREPMALVLRFGEGRVFHTPLGHVWPGSEDSRRSFANPYFHLLMARGAEWAASGRCTINSEVYGIPAPSARGVRPQDPFVFRCVLDQRPRMLVAALDRRLWVAFDTQTASFYGAWPGGVEFVGPVYNGDHGPQPKTRGTFYRRGVDQCWRVRPRNSANNPESKVPEARYLGYRIEKGEVVINFELRVVEGDETYSIQIEERPRISAIDPVLLFRGLTVRGLPDHLTLELDLDDSGPSSRMPLHNGENEFYYSLPLRENP